MGADENAASGHTAPQAVNRPGAGCAAALLLPWPAREERGRAVAGCCWGLPRAKRAGSLSPLGLPIPLTSPPSLPPKPSNRNPPPREFFQCDFDIAGSYPAMVPDAEVLKVGGGGRSRAQQCVFTASCCGAALARSRAAAVTRHTRIGIALHGRLP